MPYFFYLWVEDGFIRNNPANYARGGRGRRGGKGGRLLGEEGVNYQLY
jgi:hypothetical protein